MNAQKIAVITILLLPSVGLAASTNEKIETLVRAQGLLEAWQQQVELGRVEGHKQGRQMLEQLTAQLNLTPEFKERFDKVFLKFMGKIQNNWTAQDLVNVWAKYFGPRFTDEELDQLISFYTSDVGRKYVRATKETLIEFSNHFQQESQPIMKNAVEDYIAELQALVKECKCQKKQ